MRPAIRLLDDEQFEVVLDEALRILAQVGVMVAGRGLRERLLDAGFKAGGLGGRILFPADRARSAIDSVPASFTLFEREGQPAAEMGSVRPTSRGSSGLSVLDHRNARATAEVERLLGAWDAPPPDKAIDREARAIIRAAIPASSICPTDMGRAS